jgi:hypothetical protein
MSKNKPAAMLKFEEWTGLENPRVIPEDMFSKGEIALIEKCHRNLVDKWEKYIRDAEPESDVECRELMAADGVRYLLLPFSLLAIDEGTQKLLGGIANGMLFVKEHARGRGIATNMHICVEENQLNLLFPSHFSSGGYAARRSAHKKLCVKAFNAGDQVHPANIEEYKLHDLAADRESLPEL